MTESEYYLYSEDGAVATITFNRPEKRNGLDLPAMLEFESYVHRVRDNRAIKILIVTGTGPAFCGGADLGLVRNAKTEEERAAANSDQKLVPRIIGRVFDVMVHMEKITIGAINGFTVGGGWSLSAGFDHTIAVEGATFWLPEVPLGMPFKGLANIGLTQRLGPALAKEAMILGRKFTAEELLSYRVINQVCDPDDLMAEAHKAAQAYLTVPWAAAIGTRREINGAVYGPQYY